MDFLKRWICKTQVWFSNRRARLRKHTGANNMPNMGPPMPLAMPQYSSNINNPNQADVHQVAHYDHLVQQSQHSSYGSGFHHNATAGIMSQNYSGSVHFQPSVEYATKLPNDDYKYSSDQLIKMPTTPPLPASTLAPTIGTSAAAAPSSTLSSSMKTYTDHMNESNWNHQMYSHHQVYGPPNEYSQMQQNYVNPNPKYWS